ncbi:MAG TPA: M23 family metallopeptidase [Actinomycetaceae bacterium]|nr:M23 family metallopeptidase [Actinomycetaceae bacterium]
MPSSAGADQSLTRRQLREMERLAEAEQIRESERVPAGETTNAQEAPAASVSSPLPSRSASSPTRTPTRREMRAAERAAAAASEEAVVLAPHPLEPEITAPVDENTIPAGERRSPSLTDDGMGGLQNGETEQVPPTAERVRMGAEPSEAATIALSPAGARHDVRTPDHHRQPVRSREQRIPWKPVRTGGDHGLSRAALLGTLGVVTIAAPMTGFADATMAADASVAAAMSVRPIADATAGAAATHILEGTVSSATTLREDPFARLVATDLASRQQAQVVSAACEPTLGASGFSEAYVQRLQLPVRPMAEGTYRDTSLYGDRWGTLHLGTDMAAPVGTPIYAVADGVVVHAGDGIEGRSGTLVIIQAEVDGVDTWFWYVHMFPEHVYVEVGDTVRAGQLIAGVGNRGRSTGPHLHFEVHVGERGNTVDPLEWLAEKHAIFPGQC